MARARFAENPLSIFLIAKSYLHYSLLAQSYHNNPLLLFIFTNCGPRVTPKQSSAANRGRPAPVLAEGLAGDAGRTTRCAGPHVETTWLWRATRGPGHPTVGRA